MQETISALLSSQSTKKSQPKNQANDDVVMVSFAELQFDLEEENTINEMITSGKQFKVLNSKMNSIL